MDYKDPSTGKPLVKEKETCWFFRMSKYETALRENYESNETFILPSKEKENILKFMEDGLQDQCVSRTRTKWGIPVENYPDHVMYVWLDALINYLSGVDYPDGPNAHFWPADVHIIGKDITRFHTIIWPCMLMSCGVPLPRC